MLKQLHIRNFAIIDSLELEFTGGMTVLSGETGAGKSILLDALGLALGDRAESGAVRPGSQRAEVSAGFLLDELPEVAAWLAEQELDADGECLVRRTVGSDGRSRGYVNGQPVPAQSLKELGDLLVDIHGQHAHQSLLRREVQRQLLDEFAGHGKLVAAVAEAWRRWRDLRDELTALAASGEEGEARRELLRYQVEELEALELKPGELEALEEEQRRLANANGLIEGCQGIVEGLDGDEGAAADLLGRMGVRLRELAAVDAQLAPVAEMLEGATIQAREAAVELRHYAEKVDLDPERLAAVESRLDALHATARKHRVEPEALPELFERLGAELTALEGAATRAAALEGELAAALADYTAAAEKLSTGRAKAAAALTKRISANMQELGMKGGRFEVALTPLDDPEPAAHGRDRIEFLVTANPGQPPRPLAKVASGGELSRISLAIQTVTAARQGVPTLIFDEVDVGVGGAVAEMVGRQLRGLGGRRQVLCVTHQPQVAAQGHHHLQIRKRTAKGATRTEVQPLDADARVGELARMLGGLEITAQTESHAREMIERAQSSE